MSSEKVRSLIALLVLGVFMLITAAMAIYPLFSPTNVDLQKYSDYFAKTASVYTGLVGVIVGYYFGRTRESDNASPSP